MPNPTRKLPCGCEVPQDCPPKGWTIKSQKSAQIINGSRSLRQRLRSWLDNRCSPWLACRRHGRCFTHSGDVETGCDSPVMPGRRCPKCGMYMPPKAKVPRRCFNCNNASPELHTVHNGGPVYSCKDCMPIVFLEAFKRFKEADYNISIKPC